MNQWNKRVESQEDEHKTYYESFQCRNSYISWIGYKSIAGLAWASSFAANIRFQIRYQFRISHLTLHMGHFFGFIVKTQNELVWLSTSELLARMPSISSRGGSYVTCHALYYWAIVPVCLTNRNTTASAICRTAQCLFPVALAVFFVCSKLFAFALWLFRLRWQSFRIISYLFSDCSVPFLIAR